MIEKNITNTTPTMITYSINKYMEMRMKIKVKGTTRMTGICSNTKLILFESFNIMFTSLPLSNFLFVAGDTRNTFEYII